MSEENQYVEQRRAKVAALRAAGIDPYPNKITPTATAAEIAARFGSVAAEGLQSVAEKFSVAGRMIFRRSFGKACFVKLRDRTGEVQIFVQKQAVGDEPFTFFQGLDVGDFLWVAGHLFRTKTGELTLHAETLKLVTKSTHPLPEKWHGLTDIEARYRQRYVDLIANPEVKEIFITRSRVIAALRDFLQRRAFLEVETPMMHPIPGGAAAKPFITHHNKLDMDLYLRIAPELYLKRLVVGGFERVFEINRNFRNEGISIQHNPEFTMLEFYQSYATYEDLMALTEEMLSAVVSQVHGGNSVAYQGTAIDFSPPFARYTLHEALVKLAKVSPSILADRHAAVEFAQSQGIHLKREKEGLGAIVTELFEVLCEKALIQPTFITGYPREVSPLARKNDENPEITDRFELFIFGREIANGFSELNDPEDQAGRFRQQAEALFRGDDEAMHFDEDYIQALEYGMPPTAGEGIGIDRLVMLLTNAPSIRDVILFPQLKKKE